MFECLAGRSRLELVAPSPRRFRQLVVGAKQLLVVNVRGITGVVVHAGTFGDRTRRLIDSIVRMHYNTGARVWGDDEVSAESRVALTNFVHVLPRCEDGTRCEHGAPLPARQGQKTHWEISLSRRKDNNIDGDGDRSHGPKITVSGLS